MTLRTNPGYRPGIKEERVISKEVVEWVSDLEGALGKEGALDAIQRRFGMSLREAINRGVCPSVPRPDFLTYR